MDATSNLLGVSKTVIVEIASAPLNAIIHYSDGKLKGDKSPGLTERPQDPIVIGYAISHFPYHVQ